MPRVTSRPHSPTEFIAWNEEMVQRYDPDRYHTRSPLPVRLIERLRVRAIARLLDARPHDRVLEVGCGGGNVLERIAGRRVGLDLSPFILGKARARLGAAVPLVRGDATHLPFASGSFNRLFCSEVLEHLLDPRAALVEMRRVIRDDGVVVVSVPNEDLINQVKRAVFALPVVGRLARGGGDGYQVSEKMDDEWHLHAFSRAMLEELTVGLFRVTSAVGVPSTLVPLRWVVRLEPTAR